MAKWRGAPYILLIILLASPTPLATFTGAPDSKPRPALLFLTHAEELQRSTPRILSLEAGGEVDIVKVNYCIHPFRGWGRYFELQDGWSDEGFAALLEPFEEACYLSVLYVDVTEAASGVSSRWSGSVAAKDPGGLLDLMTLNPEEPWYGYLKAGMLDLARRFPAIDGFAIDRLDRCADIQEDLWAARLLDEVEAEAGRPLVYVMNSLQPRQADLASRAYMVGTDGVEPEDLEGKLTQYRALAEHARSGVFYLAPLLSDEDPKASGGGYSSILRRYNVVMVDDRPQYLDVVGGVPALGSGS